MELPTNQYHLTFNIPIAFWPDWANYATIGNDNEVRFWQNKPRWSGGRWTVIGGKKCASFNIPIAFWPDWANYATIGNDNEVRFWQNKPRWSGGRWTVIGGKKCAWGYVPAIAITDFSRCIWDRSKS